MSSRSLIPGRNGSGTQPHTRRARLHYTEAHPDTVPDTVPPSLRGTIVRDEVYSIEQSLRVAHDLAGAAGFPPDHVGRAKLAQARELIAEAHQSFLLRSDS